MKTLTLILTLLALALTARGQLNQMTLVGQYVGENSGDYFGSKTTMGDFDADGHDEFFIAAMYWQTVAKNYYYDWDGGWPTGPTWTFQGTTPYYRYDIEDQNVADLNGDGIEDFAVVEWNGSTGNARLDLLCGSADFDSMADWSMSDTNAFYMSSNMDSCGDVNGDGGNDFIGRFQHQWPGAPNQMRIYFGGAALDTVYDWQFTHPDWYCDGVGDVNADGYYDVMLLGNPPMLFFGGNPMDTIPDLIFPGYSTTGSPKSAIGDVNDDGYNDVCMAMLLPDCTYVYSYVYWGGPNMDANPDLMLLNEYGFLQGVGFVTSGDVNGDGISDLIGGAYSYGYRSCRIFLGGPWFNPVPDAVIEGVDPGYNWGDEISTGDVNADGRDEVLVTSSDYWFEQGLAQLFTGPETWIDYGAVVEPSDLPRIPGWFKLKQNYPNPFNSSTSIHFELGKPSTVNLQIYDLRGAEINHLIVNQQMFPGGYNVSWNGKNKQDQQVSSGIYLLELQVDQYRQMKKMVLIR